MLAKTGKVWMDGRFVDSENANVHILTQALHYGYGAFEGIRCYKTTDGRSAIFRLPEHTKRLFNSAKILQMDIPFSEEQMNQACRDVVRENKFDECYIRPLIYAGEGGLGLYANNPTRVGIAAWKWGAYLGDNSDKGVRARVSSYNRHHVNVAMVQGKICGQYTTSILAKREVSKAGYDEAIMLDTEGYVAEATAQNIFTVKDKIIRTPPDSSPILQGITRDSIIKIGRDLGYDVREEKFTRDHMYVCDEIFLTGTAAEIVPVIEVDDRRVGNGKVGEYTKSLHKLFFEIIKGQREEYKRWLSFIDE